MMTTILAIVKQNSALEQLRADLPADVKLIMADQATASELAQVDIIYGWGEVGKKILAQPQHQVKWIQTISAGVDALPLAQLQQQHVLLSNTSGIHAESIAESVIGMLLMHVRGLQQSVAQQAQAQWHKLQHHQLTTLKGKKLLVYGTGHIGQRIAELAEAIGMKTSGVNRSGHPAAHFAATYTMDTATTALVQADVIVNVMPLTKTTENFFAADFFKQLQQQPIFVNVGRGLSVDTDALLNALQQQQLGFAALDVVAPEPLPAEHPLWRQENVLLMPHIAGIFDGYMGAANQIFVANLQEFLATGQLVQNQVELQRGY
ncbi:NAD(P)-dependent oxidoreductase [Loigolactobacillus zhaoyuanensis]|uniref:NAD(P)-dependent oxidoreductase n=1 Tax=Loigolactobacillus zhaoyuanensis TaxID=2486017 RepID=A0ABW8UB08_9LACO|nr:NAD(P)-dependent oxidoreductase [Loigolactobacillus zhaoyuanensis]